MKRKIKKYFEKPHDTEALQYTDNMYFDEIKAFVGEKSAKFEYGEIIITTFPEQTIVPLKKGDFIVKDLIFGHIKVYSEEIFNKIYSEAYIPKLTIDSVITSLKIGAKVTREVWEDDEYLWINGIEKQKKSSALEIVYNLFSNPSKKEDDPKEILHHKDGQDVIWQPTLEDVLAKDWMIFEEQEVGFNANSSS